VIYSPGPAAISEGLALEVSDIDRFPSATRCIFAIAMARRQRPLRSHFGVAWKPLRYAFWTTHRHPLLLFPQSRPAANFIRADRPCYRWMA